MAGEIHISGVISIAAGLLVVALLLSAFAQRRTGDGQTRRGLRWLFAAILSFLTGTLALQLAALLPFWLGAGLVLAGAQLGILFGHFALADALGVARRGRLFLGVAAASIAGQGAVAAAMGEVGPLMVTSSVFNGALAAVFAARLWPRAAAMGLEHGLLAAAPFAAIALAYLLRLPVIALGMPPAVLVWATLLISFLLAFSALQWCFALMAFRAARLNRWLAAERARAEEASRLKSQFLATMSHELRTPLNGVLGMAEALAARRLDPAERAMIATIRASGEGLLGTLTDILAFAEIEAGRVALAAAPFRPAELLDQVAGPHRQRAREKGIAFELVAGHGLEAPRMGDAARVAQILDPLIGNAVKFTEAGHVRVEATAGPEGLAVTVADTGAGMTADQMARVVDAFVQADGGVTRRFGGTGLGLPIACRLADLMGGRIDLASSPGAGSRATLRLPLPEAELSLPAPAAVAGPEPAPDGDRGPRPEGLAGLRVLMAEDNRTNQAVVRAMLRDTGVALTIVDNGRLAVTAAAAARFDLFLFDVSMPEMDGPAALAAIAAAEASAGRAAPPAIVLTAHAMPHQVTEYLACGFALHLAKPVSRGRLIAALADVSGRAALPSRDDPARRAAAV